MNKHCYLIICLLIITCHSVFGQFGQAIISYQPIYENENNYFPHDHFLAEDMGGILDSAVSIKIQNEELLITNTFNSGFTGHEIQFSLSTELKILRVTYDEWSDMIDGSETKFIVEKVILSINKNPFEETLISGHYTLQIKEEYSAGEILKNEGIKDTITYKVFNGKFKIYSEEEIKNGKEWVLNQVELTRGYGGKDSLGVYHYPDIDATFDSGQEKLDSILNSYKVYKNDFVSSQNRFATIFIIVNSDGSVNPDEIYIREPLKTDRLLNQIKSDSRLINGWIPAIHKNKHVKSAYMTSIRTTNE